MADDTIPQQAKALKALIPTLYSNKKYTCFFRKSDHDAFLLSE